MRLARIAPLALLAAGCAAELAERNPQADPASAAAEEAPPPVPVTLNQPARFNALSGAMLHEVAAALRTAERDAAVRVIVLTGAGKAFCSGADITEFNIGDAPLHPGEHLRTILNPLTVRMRSTEKPILAAINGGRTFATRITPPTTSTSIPSERFLER